MALESDVNYISDLNEFNPSDGDLAMDGDNHIRNIKKAIKQTLPGVTGPILCTQVELNKLNALATTKQELLYLAGVRSAVQQQIDLLIPVGTISAFPSNVLPPGRWLFCTGQALNRVDYAALFAVIGGSFGVPDSLTFSAPDLRGVFIRGYDGGRALDVGRVICSYQADDVKSHNHSAGADAQGYHSHYVNDPGHSHGFSETGGNGGSGGGESYSAGSAQLRTFYRNTSGSGTGIYLNGDGNHSHNIIVNNNGIYENRVKNVALNYIIKY